MSLLSSPVKGVSHIQLSVSDVALSERWYTLVLGLERMTADNEEDKEGTYVALLHRPSKMVVVLSLGAGPASSGPASSGPASSARFFALPTIVSTTSLSSSRTLAPSPSGQTSFVT